HDLPRLRTRRGLPVPPRVRPCGPRLPRMKAYLVGKYKSAMRAGETAEPTVGDRDVLVEIHAAGVNLLDAKIRDGDFKLILPYKAPFVLGHDLAGIVTRVGSAVTRFAVGDEVYARPRDGRVGTFAQRIAVHEDDLAIKPASLSMAEAASVPLVALTAWQALVERPNLHAGQRCSARRNHDAQRLRSPPPDRRPDVPVRCGAAGARSCRRRPSQGQGRHHDGLSRAPACSLGRPHSGRAVACSMPLSGRYS